MKKMNYWLCTLILILGTSSSFAEDTVLAEHAMAQQNKKLVVDFYQNILFAGKLDMIDQYIGDVYIQHNPQVADGKQALVDMLKGFPPSDQPTAEIVRAIAENDLVVLHVKNYNWPTERGSAVIDIFRVKDNKIVEHWDVIQSVPKESANNNGMF